MPELAKPYEIYEWQDGETREFTIERYEQGELEIQPRDGRASKVVPVLRIYVPAAEKPTFPPYWDLTSTRLVAQLVSVLGVHRGARRRVKVTAIGTAPRTHYSVTSVPEELR